MRISIAIRCRNDGIFIEQTLKAIAGQTRKADEILVFDNASSDSTKDILKRYPFLKIFDIADGEYVPGKVLNLAVSECDSDIIVFNNADAVPQDEHWLAELVSPIMEGAAAAYARQIPRRGAKLWVRRDYARAFPESGNGSGAFFSMASSAVRTDVFERISFDESLAFSEDVMFAKQIRENGLKVAYSPSAAVEHSHNYDAEGIARRFYGEGKADAFIFAGRKYPLSTALRRFLADCLRDFLFAARRGGLSEFPESVVARFLQKKSYYLGRKDGAK